MSVQTYTFSVPGVAFNNDRSGAMLIRFHINDAIKLREEFLRAARELTELAVREVERQQNMRAVQVQLPPTPEVILERKKREIQQINIPPLPPQVSAMPAAHLPAVSDTTNVPPPMGGIQNSNPPAVPLTPPGTVLSNGVAKIIAGYEPDDGELGPPPASIR